MADESLETRITRILTRTDVMDQICAFVANGGTLISLCEVWDVPYGRVTAWIHEDKERSRRYVKALNDRGEWAVERILQEIGRLALSDVREIFDEAGNVKDPSLWPQDVARAVASIEVFEEFQGRGKEREYIGQTKKVKFWDKTRALEMLGKNLRMFVDRVEHSGQVSLADLVLRSLSDDAKKDSDES